MRQAGAFKECLAQIEPAQIATAKIGTAEIDAPGVDSTQVEPAKVSIAEVYLGVLGLVGVEPGNVFIVQQVIERAIELTGLAHVRDVRCGFPASIEAAARFARRGWGAYSPGRC